jgi:hypothetical protein
MVTICGHHEAPAQSLNSMAEFASASAPALKTNIAVVDASTATAKLERPAKCENILNMMCLMAIVSDRNRVDPENGNRGLKGRCANQR